MFDVGDFIFSYDLKSVYHNIEIFEEHQQYLGDCKTRNETETKRDTTETKQDKAETKRNETQKKSSINRRKQKVSYKHNVRTTILRSRSISAQS